MTKLILVVPDPEIPLKRNKLPQKLIETLVPGRLDTIVVLGSSVHNSVLKRQLSTFAKNVIFLQSRKDLCKKRLSDSMTTISFSGKKVVFASNFSLPASTNRALKNFAKEHECDLLVYSGKGLPNSTKGFLSCGSFTGCPKSFSVLALEYKQPLVYNYIIDQEDNVDVKSEFVYFRN